MPSRYIIYYPVYQYTTHGQIVPVYPATSFGFECEFLNFFEIFFKNQ